MFKTLTKFRQNTFSSLLMIGIVKCYIINTAEIESNFLKKDNEYFYYLNC